MTPSWAASWEKRRAERRRGVCGGLHGGQLLQACRAWPRVSQSDPSRSTADFVLTPVMLPQKPTKTSGRLLLFGERVNGVRLHPFRTAVPSQPS